MPPHPHTYILFIGGLGGLVQWFVPYCGTNGFEGGVSVPLVPDVPLVPLVGRV